MIDIIFKVKSLTGVVDELMRRFGEKSPVRRVEQLPKATEIELAGEGTDRYQVVVTYDDSKKLFLVHNKDRDFLDASYLTHTDQATLFDGSGISLVYARRHVPNNWVGNITLERTPNHEVMHRYLAIPSFMNQLSGALITDPKISNEQLVAYLKREMPFFLISSPSDNILANRVTGEHVDRTTDVENSYRQLSVGHLFKYQVIRLDYSYDTIRRAVERLSDRFKNAIQKDSKVLLATSVGDVVEDASREIADEPLFVPLNPTARIQELAPPGQTFSSTNVRRGEVVGAMSQAPSGIILSDGYAIEIYGREARVPLTGRGKATLYHLPKGKG